VTGRLRRVLLAPAALGAFGASILAPSSLNLGPHLQILDLPLTDTGQLTLIIETKLTLTLALTLTDTVMLISQSKLSIYLSVYIHLFHRNNKTTIEKSNGTGRQG